MRRSVIIRINIADGVSSSYVVKGSGMFVCVFDLGLHGRDSAILQAQQIEIHQLKKYLVCLSQS